MKIKKGDNVVVLTGKDRGKQAKVLNIFPKKEKILLEGLNLYKRHERPRKAGQKGQIVERAMPLHISNVLLFCPKCKKGVRVGAVLTDGKKLRVCKKCKSTI